MCNILTDMKLFRYITILALAASTALNAYADKTNFRWIKDIDYAKVRHFSQGHSAFQENGKWGFINTAGEVVVEPQYDECHDYHNGYAAVKVNGKWGYIDIKHNLVIAPEFQDVEDFKNDLAIVIRDGKWGVINKTGKSPAGIIFDEIQEYRDGYALAYADGIQYFLDDEGEIRRLHKGFEFSGYSNGMAAVKNKKKNKWGFIDKKGRLVIDAKYDTVYSFSNNIALVKHRGMFKYIKKSGGEQYIEGITGQPLEFVNGFAKIKLFNGYSYIGSDFKRIPYTYREVSDFKSNGLAAVRLGDNSLSYINSTGKEKFKMNYDMIGDFSTNGLALVKKNGKFGYINTEGKLVIDTLFTDATDFQYNHAYVATEDRFGFIKFEQGYKIPTIAIANFSMADNGDELIEAQEPFTVSVTVRNPSNEEMKDVKVRIANQVAHEEWFNIDSTEIIISSLKPRTDSTVVFNCSSNMALESGEISMRLAAHPGNMLCQDVKELSFRSRGIAASKPSLNQYWVHTEDHRPLYDWVVREVGWWPNPPRQIEFARLNLTYTVMSKRFLRSLVEGGLVDGWDDPRMPTLCGLRRRGYTPASIRDFCSRIGVAKSDSLVDIALLEHCVREDLNEIALRRVAVLDPIRVVVENYPEDKVEYFELPNNPKDENAGTRKVAFTKELYIDSSDFALEPPPKFFRLKPDGEVRLMGAYIVKYQSCKTDENGKVTEITVTADLESGCGNPVDGRKIKGTIHWVSATESIETDVYLYNRLFTIENTGAIPEDKTYDDYINPESEVKLTGCRVEKALAEAQPGEKFQFVRTGYFAKDTKRNAFLRIVELKDSKKF